MATVDIDMHLPIDEIAEPVHLTLSIEEVRTFLSRGFMPDDVVDELQNFVEEYDAHGR